jgi:hypothetical protein
MTLTHHHAKLGLSVVLDQLRTKDLVPAGAPGGPEWTPRQQALLLSSLEAGWPTGVLLAWIPTGSTFDPWHVLDGHRRLAVLACLQARTTTIVRDLHTDEPGGDATYLPRPPDGAQPGQYLPAAVMPYTMRFLAATREYGEPDLDRAEEASRRLLGATISVVFLVGGTADEVAQACERLLPDRVDHAALRAIPTVRA